MHFDDEAPGSVVALHGDSHSAQRDGPSNDHDTPSSIQSESIPSLSASRIAEIEVLPPESHEAMALAFAVAYQFDVRYVAAWDKWIEWTGVKWVKDETLKSFDLVRQWCRKTVEFVDAKVAKAVVSVETVAAVIKLSKSDRLLAATHDQWDTDQYALNTPAGVVNLRTGNMFAHDPNDYMTKVTAASPGGECPRWHVFLERITGRDMELQRYLARVCGYCLTGDTKEQVMFFCHGTGANGKSVLVNTFASILFDYAKTSPVETFTSSRNDRHPTELANLQGARFVTAIETEEGRHWDEAKLKSLTGGDTISARRMRQDFFEFKPIFKLMIVGNHMPGLRSVDEAIRRRLHLIPFTVTIPPEERDADLSVALKEEWPGILQWMIDGCLEWQKTGLAPPKCVTDATKEYLEAEDTALTWINECCWLGPEYRERSLALYASYKQYAEKTGERPHSHKAFATILKTRGFKKVKENSGKVYSGICVKPSMLRDEL